MDGSLLISGGADLVICFLARHHWEDEVAKLQQLLSRYDMLVFTSSCDIMWLPENKSWVTCYMIKITSKLLPWLVTSWAVVFIWLTDMLDMDDIEWQFLSTIISMKPSEVGKIILWISLSNILTDCGFNVSNWYNVSDVHTISLHVETLLKYINRWNTNGRLSRTA